MKNEISHYQLGQWASWQRALLSIRAKNLELNLRQFIFYRSVALAKKYGLTGEWMERLDGITETVRRINSGLIKLENASKSVIDQKFYLRFSESDFEIVQLPGENQEAITEFQGFGGIPLIIGLGVFVFVVVAGSWSAVKICDSMQAKTIAELQILQLQAEKAFAASNPTTQAAWSAFKKLQAPTTQKIETLSGSIGGVFEKIGSVIFFALAAFLAFKLFKGDSTQ